MDFQWLNAEYTQVVGYQEQHFSQCSAYPEICPPISDSCATGLCNNCPRYYDKCCLQSTAAYTDCFSSLANKNVPPITMTMGGGGGGNAGGSAAATSGGGESAAMATSMSSSVDMASLTTPATTPAPTSMPVAASSAAHSVGSLGSSNTGGSSTTQSVVKAGGTGRGGVKVGLMVGMCLMAMVFVR